VSEAPGNHTPFQSLVVRRQHLHEQIADSIQDLIATEQLAPGSQLPSERDLAKLLGVNRATVREAIRALEQRGLLQMRMGSGTYIAAVPLSTVTDSIERYFAFGSCTHRDLIKLREMWEPEIAALAAEQATREEVAELLSLQDQLERAYSMDVVSSAELDARLHELLAFATHNQLVAGIAAGLHKVMVGWIYAQTNAVHRDEGMLSHRAIVDAVAAHDPGRAREAMRAHHRYIGQTLTGDVDQMTRLCLGIHDITVHLP
jgi:DNA-binding FadR family transcriptional regulator